MKPSPFLFFALFASFAVTSSPAADPADDTAPIPVPPMQGKPWTPPATKLPPVVVSAVKELFDQGLADPRGCEYRELEFAIGSDGYHEKHHGWLLPGDGDKRYAVGWNGLVYLVMKIGPAVELRKDFDPVTHGLGDFVGNHHGMPIWERTTLSEKSELHIKVAFLLRLDEVELAEGVWNEGTKGNKEMAEGDPYVWMAQTWLTQWHDRVEVAFLQGNYQLAAQSGRALLTAAKEAEATAARRGIPKRSSTSPYFGADRQLPEIIADAERRVKEPPYVPVLKSGTPSAGPKRIAALIRDLELVSVGQHDFPGQPEIIEDPIVRALIKEGDAAVGPLIACIEEDPPRFTKTIFTQGTFPTGGPLVPVYEPADIALTAILKISVPLPEDANPHELTFDQRKALAAKFRAYWDKYKGQSQVDRWYSELRDDNAEPGEWIQAANNIVLRTSQTVMPGNSYEGGMSIGTDDPMDTSAPMRGEKLRGKSNPTVSELLVKRFNQVLPLAKADNMFNHSSVRISPVDAASLLDALADWDGKARADDLQKLTRQFNDKFPEADVSTFSTVEFNGTLYERRFAAGDTDVVADYAEWLAGLKPDDCRGEPGIFHIMWRHPNDPAIRKAAEKMFAGRDAAWHDISGLLNTALLGIPAFRERVLAALDDTTVIGHAGQLDSENSDGEQAGPPPGMAFRRCDYYANRLSQAETFPDCELDWPQEKRDASVAACKAMLRQYGDAFQFHPPDAQFEASRAPNDHAQPVFARLDHPATPEDVAQGRAIFSLTGKVRLCAMPALPLYANRSSSKQDPVDGLQMDMAGNSKKVTTYTTDGHVWQAEEAMVDGKWERYYGFSGRHQLEKVPASEIEFPGEYPWVAATRSLDCKLDGPQTRKVEANDWNTYLVTTPNAPLVVTLKVRNRAGLPQQVPGALMPPAKPDKGLPASVSLSLSWSEKIPPEVLKPPVEPVDIWTEDDLAPFHYGEWREIPFRKATATTAAQTPGPLLDAANELALVQIDLRDSFDITRPGSYRLVATFRVPGEKEAKSEEIIFSLVGKTK